MAGHAHAQPARRRYRDAGLQTNVVRTYGYRGRCDCGWRGGVRDVWSEAEEDARTHNREAHGRR